MYLAIIFMSKFPTPQVRQCIYILGTWSRKKLTFRFLAKRVVLLGAQGSTIGIAAAIVLCLNLLLILHLIAERKPDTNQRVQPHITIFWYWYPNFFFSWILCSWQRMGLRGIREPGWLAWGLWHLNCHYDDLWLVDMKIRQIWHSQGLSLTCLHLLLFEWDF